jgi:hypothetical protein
MTFLKRLFGGGEGDGGAAGKGPPASPAELEADESERDRALQRAEAERLSDELIQRQLRYADRSWTPPAQGGTRRADDEGAPDS